MAREVEDSNTGYSTSTCTNPLRDDIADSGLNLSSRNAINPTHIQLRSSHCPSNVRITCFTSSAFSPAPQRQTSRNLPLRYYDSANRSTTRYGLPMRRCPAKSHYVLCTVSIHNGYVQSTLSRDITITGVSSLQLPWGIQGRLPSH